MRAEPLVHTNVDPLLFETLSTPVLSAPITGASVVQVFKDVGGVQPPDTADSADFYVPFFKTDHMESQLEALQRSTNLPQD